MQRNIIKVRLKLRPPTFNGERIQILNIKNKLKAGDKR
jgi:hypothetical protein